MHTQADEARMFNTFENISSQHFELQNITIYSIKISYPQIKDIVHHFSNNYSDIQCVSLHHDG